MFGVFLKGQRMIPPQSSGVYNTKTGAKRFKNKYPKVLEEAEVKELKIMSWEEYENMYSRIRFLESLVPDGICSQCGGNAWVEAQDPEDECYKDRCTCGDGE